MKRFFSLIASFFVLCSAVSAVEPGVSVSDEIPVEVVEDGEDVMQEVSELSSVADVSGETDSSVSPAEENSEGRDTVYVLAPPASSDGVNYGDLTDIPVGASIDNITVSSVSPVQPSDTTGLKSALLGVLGNYDPVIVEYEYSDRNGYKNYLRDVQPDYVWLCSCALLALVIYCLFRLGGALIRE